MIRVDNITNETNQRHIILFEDFEIVLVLRFHPQVESWFMDIDFRGKQVKGVRLALGTLHVVSHGYPFDFFLTGSLGVDPFKSDDFASDRCKLYMLEAADMEQVRGVAVEI